jgi:alpha-amylase
VFTPKDYTESNCYDQKQAIVHLFEWHWDWIADECEKVRAGQKGPWSGARCQCSAVQCSSCRQVLGPKGFCGVQVSPPMEHVQGGQWWTPYQPVSWKLESRWPVANI